MSNHEGIWTEYRPTYADHWSACKRMGDLVRCRDCERATNDGYGCTLFDSREQGASYRWEDVPAEVDPDGFCAWGERRDA